MVRLTANPKREWGYLFPPEFPLLLLIPLRVMGIPQNPFEAVVQCRCRVQMWYNGGQFVFSVQRFLQKISTPAGSILLKKPQRPDLPIPNLHAKRTLVNHSKRASKKKVVAMKTTGENKNFETCQVTSKSIKFQKDFKRIVKIITIVILWVFVIGSGILTCIGKAITGTESNIIGFLVGLTLTQITINILRKLLKIALYSYVIIVVAKAIFF